MRRSAPTFPLVPRRSGRGTPGGILSSERRGPGSDLAGLRPYRPGDDVRRVDRRASARLSAALDRDELIVREHLAEEARHVAVAVDRSPSMELATAGLPWLHKREAAAEVVRLVAGSAADAHCTYGPLEGRDVEAALAALAALPRGSFAFLVSDFLGGPPEDALASAARRVDLVPVVVQDPVWERTFPDIAGLVLPVAGEDGHATLVRLSRAETERRRRANEARFAGLVRTFDRLGLDRVILSEERPAAVLDAFRAWAGGRTGRGRVA